MDQDDLSTVEQIENLRRSVAMLEPGTPGLSREQALLVLELLLTCRLRLRHRPEQMP